MLTVFNKKLPLLVLAFALLSVAEIDASPDDDEILGTEGLPGHFQADHN